MEQNRDYSNLQKLREEIEELEEKETQKRRVVNRKKNKVDLVLCQDLAQIKMRDFSA